jgi:hypothetical protein
MVSNGQVVIDITDGSVQTIEFVQSHPCGDERRQRSLPVVAPRGGQVEPRL